LAPKKEQDNYWKKKEKHPSHKKLIAAKEACYEGLPEGWMLHKTSTIMPFFEQESQSFDIQKNSCLTCGHVRAVLYIVLYFKNTFRFTFRLFEVALQMAAPNSCGIF